MKNKREQVGHASDKVCLRVMGVGLTSTAGPLEASYTELEGANDLLRSKYVDTICVYVCVCMSVCLMR